MSGDYHGRIRKNLISPISAYAQMPSIYTMKLLKVKRNNRKELADERWLVYTQFSKKQNLSTRSMQYKIPLQIENEDTIVAGLSIRQLVIMMMWWGIGYSVFRALETSLGPTGALFFAVPPIIIGIVVALINISEMTFLPATLNYFRLQLNAKQRLWSLWTDSFSDIELGYVTQPTQKTDSQSKSSIESQLDDDANLKIWKL